MKIEIQYGVSDAPHVFELSISEINQMIASGQLTITQPTRTSNKTLTITGTQQELSAMAAAFNSVV